MAIIPGKQKVNFSFISVQARKQKKLIWVLLGLIVTIVAVYFMYIKKIPIIPSAPIAVSPIIGNDLSSRVVELLRPVTLKFPLLEDKNFKLLILPGDLPIVPGERGRSNPFAPF